MGWIRDALQGLVDGEYLKEFSWGEEGHSFALKVHKDCGEDALFVRLLPREGQPTCDLLVLAHAPQRPLLVVFVELKGTDVRHALEQVGATARRYCKTSNQTTVHRPDVRTEVQRRATMAHHGRVIGFILSGRAMPLEQQKRFALKQVGFRVFRHTGRRFSEELTWFYDRLPRRFEE